MTKIKNYLLKSSIQRRRDLISEDHLAEVSRHCLSLGRVHTFGSCDVDSEPSSSAETVEFFDRDFAVPEGILFQSVRCNKQTVLLSEF